MAELVKGVEVRRALFSLDAQALAIMREVWPVVAPHLERAIDQIVDTAKGLPLVRDTIVKNAELIKKL